MIFETCRNVFFAKITSIFHNKETRAIAAFFTNQEFREQETLEKEGKPAAVVGQIAAVANAEQIKNNAAPVTIPSAPSPPLERTTSMEAVLSRAPTNERR